ncbi:uncharacterized protein LOC112341112 [Selaginella moellendorffii]|uniref:uncharacterized protein LOC112341112 n=1 Tax=Selaginella moellendorffii TaxID=88036 RepID=UPI000D1CD9A3|nr:uncharacterized protein LOC112341112 [Selaginella moellendorffii]|eukprot:XP_024516401.1 uncharacterized protein LOC112341112 [Selaginella moellendorffii]
MERPNLSPEAMTLEADSKAAFPAEKKPDYKVPKPKENRFRESRHVIPMHRRDLLYRLDLQNFTRELFCLYDELFCLYDEPKKGRSGEGRRTEQDRAACSNGNYPRVRCHVKRTGGVRLNVTHGTHSFLSEFLAILGENFPFIVLGNKVDVDGGNSRVVSEEKAKVWCASKGNIPYFEASAKEDYNVEAAFQCIAKNALRSEPKEHFYLPETIDITNNN